MEDVFKSVGELGSGDDRRPDESVPLPDCPDGNAAAGGYGADGGGRGDPAIEAVTVVADVAGIYLELKELLK